MITFECEDKSIPFAETSSGLLISENGHLMVSDNAIFDDSKLLIACRLLPSFADDLADICLSHQNAVQRKYGGKKINLFESKAAKIKALIDKLVMNDSVMDKIIESENDKKSPYIEKLRLARGLLKGSILETMLAVYYTYDFNDENYICGVKFATFVEDHDLGVDIVLLLMHPQYYGRFYVCPAQCKFYKDQFVITKNVTKKQLDRLVNDKVLDYFVTINEEMWDWQNKMTGVNLPFIAENDEDLETMKDLLVYFYFITNKISYKDGLGKTKKLGGIMHPSAKGQIADEEMEEYLHKKLAKLAEYDSELMVDGAGKQKGHLDNAKLWGKFTKIIYSQKG